MAEKERKRKEVDDERWGPHVSERGGRRISKYN